MSAGELDLYVVLTTGRLSAAPRKKVKLMVKIRSTPQYLKPMQYNSKDTVFLL